MAASPADERSSNKATKGRRRLRFTLRALLLAVALIAVALGIWTKNANNQQNAVQRIEELGGGVIYDYSPDRRNEETGEPIVEPFWRSWLREGLGVHYAWSVIHVDVRHVSDDDLELISRLPKLESLDISRTAEVTRAGFTHLSRLRNLRSLFIRQSTITDEDLQHLRTLDKLFVLNLEGAPNITDEGLEHLSQLHDLYAMTIVGAQINGSGLRHLKRLKLGSLFLHGSQLADEHLLHVGDMASLRELAIYESRVTDEGVSHLARLSNLQSLLLRPAAISAETVERLGELPRLQELQVLSERLTPGEATAIQRKHPNWSVRSTAK